MSRAFEYDVLSPIPEIGAEPGDVLYWRYPRVALTRTLPYGEQVTLLKILPQHWIYLFFKYEDRLQPRAEDAPAPLALAHQVLAAPRPPTPLPSAGERSPPLRLVE